MEAYANALLYAIPGFVILVIIEILYGAIKKNQTHRAIDTISSLSSGITNIIKDSLGLIIVLISYPFLLKHLALLQLESTWQVYVIGFIAIDFASYWNHRLCHKINLFWNIHVIHHSSEEYNLACALRQTISNIFGYTAILLLPAAIIGVPPEIINLIAPLHLFMQFWYHTKHIGKLGFLEWFLVTPSQHRVHHAINAEYIDKNFAAIFCVWDRWFGTFQEELDDVPPVYGVLKQPKTWNPLIINFQHLWVLTKDAWRTKSYWDKLRIWFMPTGWRPADVIDKYPITIVEDVYAMKKYDTHASTALTWYTGIQLIISTLLMLYMFANWSNLTRTDLLLMAGIVALGVFAYTSLVDRWKAAPYIELTRGLGVLYLVFTTKSFFQLENALVYGQYWVLCYLCISVILSFYFTYIEKQHELTLQTK
ncbi:MAG: sterol desaturase family protein [Flavobacteriaceae bacterium]|nr:sterol desaturase family protein [Flavobacteriaceae bacterium]